MTTEWVKMGTQWSVDTQDQHINSKTCSNMDNIVWLTIDYNFQGINDIILLM